MHNNFCMCDVPCYQNVYNKSGLLLILVDVMSLNISMRWGVTH